MGCSFIAGSKATKQSGSEGRRLEHVLHQLGRRRVVNPVVNVSISGKGKNGAWFGWPEDAKLEALRDAFARASSSEDQKTIATEIQKEVYDEVIYIPLGQYLIPSAWRKSLSGVLDGPAAPIFWNIDRSE
jgi:peptide/nickel transport system substrate-binding protein